MPRKKTQLEQIARGAERIFQEGGTKYQKLERDCPCFAVPIVAKEIKIIKKNRLISI